MKTKKIILAAFLLVAGAASTEVFAQEHLEALVKKCEKLDNVQMQVIYNRDPNTKKLEKTIKSINFQDEKLLNEFLDAFEKDKEKAYKMAEQKVNGRMQPSFYRFSDGKKDIGYYWNVSAAHNVSLSVIEEYE
jgi:Domain of unknown function (DUF5024)